MRIGLKILAPFQQGAPKAYAAGAFVPEEHWQGWDAVTLSNRLKNNWVMWEPLPDDGKDETATIDIGELDKDGLVEFTAQRFGVKLDKRGSLQNMRDQVQGMLDRERQIGLNAAAKQGQAVTTGKPQQAPRPGGSGANSGATTTPAATPPAPVAPTPPAAPAPTDDTGDGADTGNQTGNDASTGSGSPQA